MKNDLMQVKRIEIEEDENKRLYKMSKENDSIFYHNQSVFKEKIVFTGFDGSIVYSLYDTNRIVKTSVLRFAITNAIVKNDKIRVISGIVLETAAIIRFYF